MVQHKPFLNNIIPYAAPPINEDKIKLLSNENPLGTSTLALKAIQNHMSNISLYPCGQNFLLKDKLSAKFKIPTKNIILGNGSDEIFTLIAGTIINPGDELVTARTTFSQYAFATKQYGGSPICTNLVDGKFSTENMLNAITDKTKWIALSNPNNPTGTYLNHSELKDFIEQIPPHILVMIDEAYCEYNTACDFPDTFELLKDHKNLIITRTFSKIYGLAGLRIGYGFAHEDIIDYLNRLRSPYNINALAQAAALAALDDSLFVDQSITNNRIGKDYLYKELDKLKLEYYPTEGNFVFINLPQCGKEVANHLAQNNILVRATASFGVENAIRTTIGKPEQNKLFVKHLANIIAN